MDEVDIYVYKAFHDFVKVCNSNEVIRLLDSNVPLPDGPFLGIKLSYIDSISWDGTAHYQENPGNDAQYIDWSTYKGRVILITYGDKAIARMQAISTGLREHRAREPLVNKGIGCSSNSRVVDISAPVDATKIEKRATMTIDFYFNQGGADRGGDYGTIETVTTDPTYNHI